MISPDAASRADASASAARVDGVWCKTPAENTMSNDPDRNGSFAMSAWTKYVPSLCPSRSRATSIASEMSTPTQVPPDHASIHSDAVKPPPQPRSTTASTASNCFRIALDDSKPYRSSSHANDQSRIPGELYASVRCHWYPKVDAVCCWPASLLAMNRGLPSCTG